MAITLEIGVNTYVTLEEANSMLEAVFDNEEWKLLTDEQKKVCLVNAANKINLLAVKGSKLDTEQALIFPRNWETATSDKVKMAQCYEALEICRYIQIKKAMICHLNKNNNNKVATIPSVNDIVCVFVILIVRLG